MRRTRRDHDEEPVERQAEGRLLGALACEALGTPVPKDLVARIRTRLDALPEAPAWPRRALAAAVLLAGATVLAAVAWGVFPAYGSEAGLPAQGLDSRPTTTATKLERLHAEQPRVTLALAEAEPRAAVVALAKQAGIDGVVLAALPAAKVRVEAKDTYWRDVLEGILAQAGACCAEYDGALCITPSPAPSKPAPRVTLALRRADARALLDQIATLARATVVVEGGVHGEIDVDLDGCHWRAALDAVARAAGARVVGIGTTLLVTSQPAASMRTVFRYADLPPARILASWIKLAGGELPAIEVDPLVTKPVTIEAKGLRYGAAVEALAAAAGAELVTVEKNVRMRPRDARAGRTATLPELDRVQASEAFALVAKAAGCNVVVSPAISGTVSLRAAAADPRELCAAIARAVGARLVVGGDGRIRIE